MLFHILQSVTPDAEKIAQRFSADSLQTKGAEIAEILRNTPPRELIEEMVTSIIKFGLKLIIALALYLIGAWLIVLWILLIMCMIGMLGINTTSLAALLAAGGMAIGMAMSGTVQNFAGGLMLLAFKPFKAGDYIEAQGFAGIVKSINIVSTKIVTLDNREVILPNGALSNGTINNYSANPIRRIDLTVNVTYGSDADAVKSELMRIVIENEKTLNAETPGAEDPTVVLSDLKDSSVEFLIRVWVRSSDIREVRYALTEAIYTGLPAHGISFPFPQLDIHLKH